MGTQKFKLGTRKFNPKSKQIVIPETAVNVLELEEGDYITFILENGKITLEKKKP